MYSVFVILAVIVAILLTLIVLIQESKGGGLASDYTSANALAGVRKTADFIEKATWSLAALLVIFSIATTFVIPSGNRADEVATRTSSSVPTLPTTTTQGAQQQTSAPAGQQSAPAQQ